MKNFTRFLLLIAACFFFSLKMNSITAFTVNPVINDGKISNIPDSSGSGMDNIIAALRSGNAIFLARYFDSRVDVSLPGKSDNYSKKQAEMIMRDFFALNTVRSFELKHNGENKDGSQYCTGTLITRNGNYRVILFMKSKGDILLLQQLSFQTIE